jgi:hypothetical protein
MSDLLNLYPDNPERTQFMGKFDPSRIDAVKQWLKHYDNWLILKFWEQQSKGLERYSANKQIQRCSKKLDYWRRMPTFDLKRAVDGKKLLEDRWERPIPDRFELK